MDEMQSTDDAGPGMQVFILFGIANYLITKWLSEIGLSAVEAVMQRSASLHAQLLCGMLVQAGVCSTLHV